MRESKLSMPFDKRQVYIEKLSKIKTGVSLSDETKLKMSLAQKGKKKSLAHRAAIKASWTLRKKRADLCV